MQICWPASRPKSRAFHLSFPRIIISTENSLPDIETSKIRRILNAPLYLLNNILDRITSRIVVISEQLKNRKTFKSAAQKIAIIPPPFNIDRTYARTILREGFLSC